METHDVEFTVKVKVQIHNDVMAQIDDEWRDMFYDLETVTDAAKHIAYNLVQGRSLSQLDGFANLPDEFAVLEEVEYE